MKNTLVILLLLIASTLQAQETYLMWNDVDTQRFGKETIFKTDNKPLEGAYKIAENSGAYTQATFKNGKMVGTKKDFDFTGKLEQEITFNENGQADGKSTSYYSNGKVYEDFMYKNGLKEGEWKTYTNKGVLQKIESYSSDLKNGKWVAHLKDASTGTKLIETSYYKDNEATGKWNQKTEDGRLIWEKNYSDAKDYSKKEYFSNGKLKSEELYKDNKLDGICTYYSSAGIILSEKKYEASYLKNLVNFYANGTKKEVADSKDGHRNGPYQLYSEDGTLILEGQFTMGYKSGEWKSYTDDKMLKDMYTFEDSRKKGPAKTYNAAGKVESEGEYLNHVKTGLWKYYKLDGKVSKETEYKNGNIVSEKKYN
jgi:antitoxin component YwqK of YwqJK toxin-antitoxin module